MTWKVDLMSIPLQDQQFGGVEVSYCSTLPQFILDRHFPGMVGLV
jgi:hypothetical protein